jgi:hypothetical protein
MACGRQRHVASTDFEIDDHAPAAYLHRGMGALVPPWRWTLQLALGARRTARAWLNAWMAPQQLAVLP